MTRRVNSDRWTADDDEMRRRRSLAKAVDTGLSREERESGLSFFGDDDHFQVFTYSPPIARKLLQHDYARIEWVYTTRDGEPRGREQNLTAIESTNRGLEIEGVCAKLPLGTLSFKGKPRQRDIVSDIVSTPEGAREARAAFEEVDE